MKFINEKAYLSNELINSWVELAVNSYEKKARKRAEETAILEIGLRDLLERFMEYYGSSEMCQLVGYSHRGNVVFEIRQKGDKINCLNEAEDHDLEMSTSYTILKKMGEKPEYVYRERGHLNVVTFRYLKKPRKNEMLKQIGAAVALAILASYLIPFLPGSAKISECLTQAVFPKCCAILSGVATPLVFVAVIGGIVGIGDMSSFGRIGKKCCFNMLKGYGVAMLITLPLMMLIFPFQASTAGGKGGIGIELVNLVLDMAPNNLFEPFVIDNALQVIMVAIFVGFIMLCLGDSVKGLRNIVEEVTTLVYKMMSYACKLIPVIVFLGIYNIFSNSEVNTLLSMYKMFLLMFVGGFILVGYMLVKTSLLVNVSVKDLMKKMSATLLINITTSSQVSALPENMKCCKQKFGLDSRMVDFGLPLGIVTYMPVGAIFMVSTIMGLAYIYHEPITVVFIVKLLLLAVITAIAAPPIPGSALITLPIMLSGCGLSTQYMTLGVVFGTIAGYFLPAFNGLLLQLLMLYTGKSLDLVDYEKLNSECVEETQEFVAAA